MPIRTVNVDALPPNNATYSQATVLNGVVYASGQLGVDPRTRELVSGGIHGQTRQALANIQTVLEAAGSSLELIARVNIYITDFGLLAGMNEVYGAIMTHRPAKTTVEVSRLDKGALLEIEAVAGLRS